MYVCIVLRIKFDKPYNIVPAADVYQEYFAPQERLDPYLADGFEVVCIEPHLFGVPKETESVDSTAEDTNLADENGKAQDSDTLSEDWWEISMETELPDEYYDTGRIVYMVKEIEDPSTFDRDKYKPDEYDCTLMYDKEDWVYEQVYCFRPENDPFAVYEDLPFKEFPSWPGTVTELTSEEKAAEKERIQELYHAVRRQEVEFGDLDVIDMLKILGMMREEEKVKQEAIQREVEMMRRINQMIEDGVPGEEIQRIYFEFRTNQDEQLEKYDFQ